MSEPTKAQQRAAAEVLEIPKGLEALRERRYEVKDILNTNLLSKEARAAYEAHYDEIGKQLEKAVKTAS